MISPVFVSVLKGIVAKGSPAGPCKTLPVDESYLEPWQGQTSSPLISWLMRQPAWVHLFEKTFSEAADFTTINFSNRNIPVPNFDALILLTTGCSDNSLLLPVIICQSAKKAAPALKVASLRNVFRFMYLPLSNSFLIFVKTIKIFHH